MAVRLLTISLPRHPDPTAENHWPRSGPGETNSDEGDDEGDDEGEGDETRLRRTRLFRGTHHFTTPEAKTPGPPAPPW